MRESTAEQTLLAPAVPVGRQGRGWRSESQALAVGRRLLRHRKGTIGAVSLLLLAVVAIASPLVAPFNPNEQHLLDQLAPPSSTYWFGTDELGRDVLSRVIYGARPALQAGFSAVILAAVIGTLTGLVAGYLGGWVDSVVMRVWDTLLAFPAIFLAIGIVTILGPGWANAVLAIAIINMPVFSRVVRATTLSAKERDFTEAARAIGCTQWRIIRSHLLPTCVVPAIVLMAIAIPEAILVEASLSFLGLGSQPPNPSWGNMLSSAQGYLARSATYALFPGLAIVYTVLAMGFFADGLQDAIDPRRGRSSGKGG
ncbi:MAG: ABC transporter permease [Chloroflexota bacterium]|nr:ABC transporter permease [Chloroflexota bacterium]